MPCRHGYVFWWDCPHCEQDRKNREHNAEFQARREQVERELESLGELKKIRRLLEGMHHE